MPEMGTTTDGEIDEVARMFEAYKIEHTTSSLTLPQFRQIYAMRQKQREKEAARTDVSQIAVDEKSMHKTAEVAAQEAAAESRTRDTEKVAMKLHTKRKAALLMAKLHGNVSTDHQQQLMGWCRGALKDDPPTLTIPELGNNVMSLCEQYLRNSEAGMELECDLRELFAELLEIPLDSFNETSGGIPRRLFAAMKARYHRKNARIAKQYGIPEEQGEEESAEAGACRNLRTGVRYRGETSACEDLTPPPDEEEYLRRLRMLEQIPKDKVDKFFGGGPGWLY